MKKIKKNFDILGELNFPKTKANRKLVSCCFAYFAYMKTGCTIKTSFGSFTKISKDTIYLNVEIDKKELLDTLAKTELLEIPV